jgi:hypothetical protein
VCVSVSVSVYDVESTSKSRMNLLWALSKSASECRGTQEGTHRVGRVREREQRHARGHAPAGQDQVQRHEVHLVLVLGALRRELNVLCVDGCAQSFREAHGSFAQRCFDV